MQMQRCQPRIEQRFLVQRAFVQAACVFCLGLHGSQIRMIMNAQAGTGTDQYCYHIPYGMHGLIHSQHLPPCSPLVCNGCVLLLLQAAVGLMSALRS